MQQYKQWKAEDFPPALRSDLERYTTWLKIQSQRYSSHGQDQELFDYAQIANQTYSVGKETIHPFAPFRLRFSAFHTLTPTQSMILLMLGALLFLSSIFFRVPLVTALCVICVVLYSVHLILLGYAFVKPKKSESTLPIDDVLLSALDGAEWPSYTILCPLYKEAIIVSQYVQALLQLDYPKDKLQVLFLLEEDDNETQHALSLILLPSFCSVLLVPPGSPRTKSRACNYGLMHAKGQYCVIYDAEDIPDTTQLKKAILTFAQHGPEVACVQATLHFYNPTQSLLTKFFTIEYSMWFDMILPAFQRIGIALPLGGTSNHFQTTYLRALGGWDAYNVTEDCDLGMRLAHYGLKTAMFPSTTYEEATVHFSNWIRQRSRWIKGYMQTYLVHTRRRKSSASAKNRFLSFFSLHWIIGSGTFFFFINPIMWILFLVYLFFRTQVEGFYHLLFPTPILYAGTFCLIFGNIFCLYIAMTACLQRKHYSLVKWCLFLPFYWMLLSFAAGKALVQLITNPHYWEKTTHGTHIHTPILKTTHEYFHTANTESVPRIQKTREVGSITEEILAMPTVQSAAITKEQKKNKFDAKKVKIRDFWVVGIVCFAFLLSCSATFYYYVAHEILLYQDAISHERIARSVFDSLTPGIAQIGTVWLPLPHIAMWLFVWNNFLWESGLAGSFISMFCYILASTFLYCIGKKITGYSIVGIISAFFFMLNPNILYLQSTPLSELVCITTLIATIYFFILWIENKSFLTLFFLACSTFFATLSRYESWPLPIIIVGVLFFLIRKQKDKKVEAILIFYSVLSFSGIVLWLFWNKMIFGDFFYFAYGPYSSHAQQMKELTSGMLYSYHNIIKSFQFYFIDTKVSVGNFSLFLGCILFFLLIIKIPTNKKILPLVAFCYIFIFYIYSLYTGQVIIWIPGANPVHANVYLYNTRYGTQMIAPFALIIGCGSFYAISFVRKIFIQRILFLFLLCLPFLQSFLILQEGIVSLQDGQYNKSCEHARTIDIFMYQHYIGGYILNDVSILAFDSASAHIDFKNVIYEGSNGYWQQALKNPASLATWVIANPHADNDLVSAHISVFSSQFLSKYHLVVQQTDGAMLFYRIGSGNLPTREAPPVYSYPHHPCIGKNS